jgi:ABC-type transport system involved in multi-copper enzyme maturation permease subunit
MTRRTTTTSRTVPHDPAATRTEPTSRQRPGGSVTIGRVLRSELVKLRSVRSTAYALLVAVLSILVMGAFMAVGVVVQKAPADGFADAPVDDPAGGSLSGVSLALYAVATLGVLVVTSEYASGTIKATLAAVPRRLLLILGKVLALVCVVLPVTFAATLTTFLAAQAILASAGRSISLTHPGVLRAIAGAALYLTVVAILGAAFGWLLRSTAGAVAALFGILVLLPAFAQLLPEALAARILPYLPDNAGTAILQVTPGGEPAPWTGFAIFCAYAAVATAVAAYVVRRRDA